MSGLFEKLPGSFCAAGGSAWTLETSSISDYVVIK